MSFNMLEAMTMIARDRNIEFDAVVATLEESLLAAARKKFGETATISFRFDKLSNELLMIQTKRVVSTVLDPATEIALDDAKREIDEAAELGDEVDIFLDYEREFGRNAIHSAKQILAQKIREVEHERIYNEYIDKVGTLVTGIVQHIDKGNLIVNLGRGEAIMPVREQIPRERFRQGDRIRALILDVQLSARGPQIVLSRANNEFLKGLFAVEVPEIYERIIEIKAIAREPGERAKVAVYSSDDRIDPVGACVGVKGVRVQSIVRELNNERIDIVPYTSNPELFVTRALAPAKVISIDTDELEQKMTVVVEDEKLSLAIGRAGQNARLASKLTGWKVNIMSEVEYDAAKKKEAALLMPVGQLDGVGETLRDRLLEHDISTVQRLAATPLETMTAIEGIGEKTAETLIERATAKVEELEAEYEAQRAAEEAAAAEAAAEEAEESEDGAMDASDMFHDDEPGAETDEDTIIETEDSDSDDDATDDPTTGDDAEVVASSDDTEDDDPEDRG